MRFTFHKEAWTSIEEGEKNCYLMANGLGGYDSLSVIGSAARGDQALFMAAKKAPNVRRHMITGLLETLVIDGEEYVLTSQRMQGEDDLEGFHFLESFTFDNYPQWLYRVDNVTVCKKILMPHGENTVAVQYEILKEEVQRVTLKVEPLMRMTAKNTSFEEKETERFAFVSLADASQYKVTSGEDTVYFATNGIAAEQPGAVFGPMYFSQDERDGRKETGYALINHVISYEAEKAKSALTCVFGTKSVEYRKGCFEEYMQAHRDYINALLKDSKVKSELGRQLTISADAYVADRESTGGKTILAGFPFFEDWGRDTMIALPGITMVTGRFKDCKSILRTFAKYVHNGLLPNLFPEGDCNPMYNSVDAPLLFINTVYEYLNFSKDEEFLPEIFPVLESIVAAYRKGTEFHIKMDSDALIQAGADLEQLTWMDVRVGDHLPTPRHGKPVEINAYWYSALRVMEELAKEMQQKTGMMRYAEAASEYKILAERVKEAFLQKFWNEEEDCLKDVLAGNSEENQVRCNQIWALTQPFTMLDADYEKRVLEKVRKELYTTIGLRTLSPKDAAFHDIYIGPMQQRDRAYHQGTVWAFPLGAYYRACIRYVKKHDFPEKAEWQQHVKDGISELNTWLKEGCVAQIAEIYDGGTPTISRGCYAQAWSVGELLWAVFEYEKLQDID